MTFLIVHIIVLRFVRKRCVTNRSVDSVLSEFSVKFSPRNLLFHLFAKVFSLDSLPLYGNRFIPPALTNQITVFVTTMI